MSVIPYEAKAGIMRKGSDLTRAAADGMVVKALAAAERVAAMLGLARTTPS